MSECIHDLIAGQANRDPMQIALRHRGEGIDYATLAEAIGQFSAGLLEQGLTRGERVGIYLPKSFKCAIALFGTAAAGGVFVPINPQLKSAQIRHILADSGARYLVTSSAALRRLDDAVVDLPELRAIIVTDDGELSGALHPTVHWDALSDVSLRPGHRVIDADRAAILYTSGSTGRPKGVVLSHRNLVAGARSVASYLKNRPSDRILAALPLSFDYGLSQLTTAFASGASAVLLDYLAPAEVIQTIQQERVTGLAGVPPLWFQLARHEWPAAARESLRYLTNSGGAMPRATLDLLRAALPTTAVFLMYGLTEAFRSTYLPPEEADRRPESIGMAIPNADILVLREDGTPCEPDEPGELVHRGALVSLGYWNDPQRTAERFRPLPPCSGHTGLPEIAVWSGDTVRRDKDGFLYFVGRKDEMIKTSGFRVSPTEVEEALFATGLVAEAVALGVPHPELGQAIVALVVARDGVRIEPEAMHKACQRNLPRYMVPARFEIESRLPRTPNGKLDRRGLFERFRDTFQESTDT